MERMRDDRVIEQLRKAFKWLKNTLEILFFGSEDRQRGQYCSETQQLLDEISELSDLLSFRACDIETDAALAAQYKVDGVPGFVLLGRDGDQLIDYGIRFKGIPAGHEFTSLINSLMLVSQRDSNLSQPTREFLRDLTQPVHLQVFVTPTCPYCPRSVVLAHQFALESPMVEAEMVEAIEFPELANRFDVSGVPQTTINMGAGTVIGAAPEDKLVAEIRAALERMEVN